MIVPIELRSTRLAGLAITDPVELQGERNFVEGELALVSLICRHAHNGQLRHIAFKRYGTMALAIDSPATDIPVSWRAKPSP